MSEIFWLHIAFFAFIGLMHWYFARRNTKKHEERMEILRALVEKK